MDDYVSYLKANIIKYKARQESGIASSDKIKFYEDQLNSYLLEKTFFSDWLEA